MAWRAYHGPVYDRRHDNEVERDANSRVFNRQINKHSNELKEQPDDRAGTTTSITVAPTASI